MWSKVKYVRSWNKSLNKNGCIWILKVKNDLDLSKNKLGFTKNLEYLSQKNVFWSLALFLFTYVCVTIEQRTNSPSQLEFQQPIEH